MYVYCLYTHILFKFDILLSSNILFTGVMQK